RAPADPRIRAPSGRTAVDGEAVLLGQRRPYILVGEMQPGGADVHRHAQRLVDGTAAADAVARPEHGDASAGGTQPPRRRDTGRTRSDDGDVNSCHGRAVYLLPFIPDEASRQSADQQPALGCRAHPRRSRILLAAGGPAVTAIPVDRLR